MLPGALRVLRCLATSFNFSFGAVMGDELGVQRHHDQDVLATDTMHKVDLINRSLSYMKVYVVPRQTCKIYRRPLLLGNHLCSP